MKNLFLILITAFFISCGNKSNNKNEQVKTEGNLITLTESQLKNSGIVLGKQEEKSISAILTVNGKIDVPPQNMVSISVPLGGYLKTTHLLSGMKVKKGEVIATMEDQKYIDIQQDYLTSKAKLNYYEKEYNRQKELNISKASSDKTYQQTESDFRTQKILIKALYEKLKLIGINPDNLDENTLSRSVNVFAPIDGYVASVKVNIGKYVNPSDVLFELVNPSDIHLALTVFEKDVNKIYIGQKLKAYTNNFPEKKYDCEIILIGQNLSAERSVEVHCHFDNYDNSLIPGMFMSADIDVKTYKAMVLPEEAVVSFDNKQYVFLERNKNEFEIKEVKCGISENGFIEIVSLDKNNTKIVVKGAYTLLMAFKNREE